MFYLREVEKALSELSSHEYYGRNKQMIFSVASILPRRSKMALTTKELMLLSDNIKMAQNNIKFMQGSVELCTDPQVRSLCDTMTKDCQSNLQSLTKHLNTTMQ
jgi:hypothetical protein